MDTKTKIIKTATHLIQTRGYNAYSYADISKEVGIRKSSLHHHFPTKAQLGISVIEDYCEELANALTHFDRDFISPLDRLRAYFALYFANLENKCACVGGMMAAESLTLDTSVLVAVERFFDLNWNWLIKTLLEGEKEGQFFLTANVEQHANQFISSLQGALILARARNETKIFTDTEELLLESIKRPN
ncbi:MAG: transcriptional regulator TetR family [Hyphomonadaceae bacterium]|nr:MAG: transcriptional regulator TetR family [Hyphomonadaceae bacterium]KAF0185054.1 MAG: transcriptional regulator TetR family [Hyphomonadaceae bacterium]